MKLGYFVIKLHIVQFEKLQSTQFPKCRPNSARLAPKTITHILAPYLDSCTQILHVNSVPVRRFLHFLSQEHKNK